MARLPALALLVPGCPWITLADLDRDLDPDGDGVLHPDDCDDGDPLRTELVAQYRDADGDGYGAEPPEELCGLRNGYVEAGGDCADDDPFVHPEQTEIYAHGALTTACTPATACDAHWVPDYTDTLDDALAALATCGDVPDDAITVSPGTYATTTGWVLTSGVEVVGRATGDDRPVFRVEAGVPAFTIVAGGLEQVVVEGTTGLADVAPEGGCVLVDGDGDGEGAATLTDVDLRSCTADRGGALAVLDHGEATLERLVVVDPGLSPTSQLGAGILVDASAVSMTDVTVDGATGGPAIELIDADGAAGERLTVTRPESVGIRVRRGEGWSFSEVTVSGPAVVVDQPSAVDVVELDGAGELTEVVVEDWPIGEAGAAIRARILDDGDLTGSDWTLVATEPAQTDPGDAGSGVELCGYQEGNPTCAAMAGKVSLSRLLVAIPYATGVHVVGSATGSVELSHATVLGSLGPGVKVELDSSGARLDHVLVFGNPVADFQFEGAPPGLSDLLVGRSAGAYHSSIEACVRPAFAPPRGPPETWDAHLVGLGPLGACPVTIAAPGACLPPTRVSEVGYYGGGADEADLEWYCDVEGDDLADGWQALWFGGTSEPSDDSDGDGLLDEEEFHLGLHPLACDTDCDGLDDGIDESLPTGSALDCSEPPGVVCTCAWAVCP